MAKEVGKKLIEEGFEDRILWDDLGYNRKVLGYSSVFLPRSNAEFPFDRDSENQVFGDAFSDLLYRDRKETTVGPLIGKWLRLACRLWLNQTTPLPLEWLPYALRTKSKKFTRMLESCTSDEVVEEFQDLLARPHRDIANDLEPAKRLLDPLFSSAPFRSRISTEYSLNLMAAMEQKKILLQTIGDAIVSPVAIRQIMGSTIVCIGYTAQRYFNSHDDKPLWAAVHLDEANALRIPGATEIDLQRQSRKWGVSLCYGMQSFSYEKTIVEDILGLSKEQHFFEQPSAEACDLAARQLADRLYDPDKILTGHETKQYVPKAPKEKTVENTSESTDEDGKKRKGKSINTVFEAQHEPIDVLAYQSADQQLQAIKKHLADPGIGWRMFKKPGYISPTPEYVVPLPQSCLTNQQFQEAIERIRANPANGYQEPNLGSEDIQQAKGDAADRL